MKRIRIGHIGLGHMHSEGKMACVRRFPDHFEVVGYAEPDTEILAKWRDHDTFRDLPLTTVEELLGDGSVDAIMVESDDLDLARYAQMCVDAGKHIHLDKPPGVSIPEFERLLRGADTASLVVQLAYMYRYSPAVLKALELTRTGALGTILQVDGVMSTEHSPYIRRWLSRFRGGTMYTFGCHLVDLVVLFQGMPQRIVPFCRKTMLDGIDVEDHDLAVFEYPRGVSTVRTSSFEINGYGRRQLVICGTDGSVEIKPLETNILADFCKATLATREDTAGHAYYDRKRRLEFAPLSGRYDTMMLDFAAMVRGEKPNPFTSEHELAVQRAMLAACGFDVDIHGGGQM